MIQHRLYRDHVSVDGGSWIKDLSLLGRDLAKVIMIDDIQENFAKQPDNGILIKEFRDDVRDRALLDLSPILRGISSLSKKSTSLRCPTCAWPCASTRNT